MKKNIDFIKTKLELSLQSSQMGAWQYDIVENKRSFDNQACYLLGINPATFGGAAEEFFAAVHPEDREKIKSALKQTIELKVMYEPEYRVVWPDGSIHHIAARGKLLCDDNGNPQAINGIIWDITERKQAEEATLQAHAQLRSVIDSASQVSIIATDISGVILTFNSGAERMLGYSKEEMVNKQTPAVIHLESEVVARGKELTAELGYEVAGFEVFVAYAKQGKYDEREWTYVKKDGKHLTVNLAVTSAKNDVGQIIGFLGIATDITERKRAEETLRRSETKYHMLYDTTSDAIMMLADGKFFDCNKSTLEIYGCVSIEEFCSKHPADFSPLKQPSGEDSLTLANKQIAIAMEKGSNRFEWVHKRADNGKEFLADVLINMMELDGKKVVHTVVRDITERKLAEEKIDNSQKLLKRIINLLPIRVFWKDKNSRYLGCNEIFAKDAGENTAEELIGKDDFQMNWKEHAESYRSDDKSVITSGKSKLNYEEAQTTPKGDKIWLKTSKIPLMDFQDNIIGVLGTYEDITERKQAEENLKKLNSELEQTVARLEDANQDLKNFVYIASHDLREPLRKISAFGSMLQKSLEGKIVDDDAENLNFMIDGAMRMSKMIEGLLVYSRVSKKAHSAETVNLNDIVKQLSQLELSVSMEEKNAVIEVPQPLPEVEADPVQLRQLMQNLISNGMKYQAKGNAPHITINSQPAADEMVRVNIVDNGIGIAPEFQQAIFVMFKRLHSKSEYEGTGIGLAVCKKIVTRHGGQIGVESEPGKGSTFWFTLPTVNTAKPAPLQEATSKI